MPSKKKAEVVGRWSGILKNLGIILLKLLRMEKSLY